MLPEAMRNNPPSIREGWLPASVLHQMPRTLQCGTEEPQRQPSWFMMGKLSPRGRKGSVTPLLRAAGADDRCSQPTLGGRTHQPREQHVLGCACIQTACPCFLQKGHTPHSTYPSHQGTGLGRKWSGTSHGAWAGWRGPQGPRRRWAQKESHTLRPPRGHLAERGHPGPTQTSYPRAPHRGPYASVTFPGDSGGRPRVGLAALGKSGNLPPTMHWLLVSLKRPVVWASFLPSSISHSSPLGARTGGPVSLLWRAGLASRAAGGRAARTSGAGGQVARERGGRVEEASSRVAWVVPADGGVGGCPGEDVESVGKAGPGSLGPSRQPAGCLRLRARL